MNLFHSLPVKVDLGTDVLEGGGHHTRHDVVVVPAPEVLVLESFSVIHLGVEDLRQLSVEHPVEEFTGGGFKG